MSGRRLTVYVAHHQPRSEPEPEPEPYLAVCNVRGDGSRPPGFVAYDDDGGLPDRNSAYSELSVLHRLQERADTDLVGLAHYRRVLLARRPAGQRGEQPGTCHVRGWDWRDPRRWAGDGDSLLGAMDGLDWVTPQPYDVRRAGYRSVWEHFVGNHPEHLMQRADDAVRTQRPELEPLRDYLRRERTTPLYNVFLGRREVLDAYCAFLWPVLDACWSGLAREESQSGLPLTGYQSRWAGFVAERLHGYWLSQVAAPAGVRVGVLPLALLDVPLPPRRQRLTGLLPARSAFALRSASRSMRRRDRRAQPVQRSVRTAKNCLP